MTFKTPQEQLFLEVYELVFAAAGMDVFNNVVERITTFVEASTTSLWIKHPRVAAAETRVAFYQTSVNEGIIQQDYRVATATVNSMKKSTGVFKDKQGSKWSYLSIPFTKREAEGCYIVWFDSEKDEVVLEDASWIDLGQKLGNFVNHLLKCSLFDCQRILEELGSAEKLQRNLIPTDVPKVSGVSVGFRMVMANEVGGDYLDLLTLPNQHLGVVIGDAMGKGIPGAFIMLTTRAIFRLLVRANVGPEIILRQLNLCLTPELTMHNMFTSLLYGVYNPSTYNFTYATAGHNPPILYRHNTKEYSILPGKGLVIGGKKSAEYQASTVVLQEEDILVVYSDGLKEAPNKSGQQFGVDGIGQTLQRYAQYDAQAISDCLMRYLMKHCANDPKDDVSIIVIKVEK